MNFLRRYWPVLALVAAGALLWAFAAYAAGAQVASGLWLAVGTLIVASSFLGEDDPSDQTPDRVLTMADARCIVRHYVQDATISTCEDRDWLRGRTTVYMTIRIGRRAWIPGYAGLLQRRIAQALSERTTATISYSVEVRS